MVLVWKVIQKWHASLHTKFRVSFRLTNLFSPQKRTAYPMSMGFLWQTDREFEDIEGSILFTKVQVQIAKL